MDRGGRTFWSIVEQLTQNLTPKQEKALAALIAEPTITAAADRAGVGRTTLYSWLKDPNFSQAYREARQTALQHATARLQLAADKAVSTLERVATDQDAPASSQVAAANHILSWAYRADTLEEIAAMLDELSDEYGDTYE